MVAAPAAGEAVALARDMPTLAVGLHLVLVEGPPVLGPDEIPDLLDGPGRLRADMVRLAVDIAARPRVRRQLAREIAAQFEAFRRTGLPLDHVDAHKHFHLHPVIGKLVLEIGRDYGLAALRVPCEPAAVLARVERAHTGAADAVAGLWARRLRARARRDGTVVPDAVFGLRWSGAMTSARMRGLLGALPEGLVEIYTHPAARDGFPGQARGYRYAEEFGALVDPEVVAAAARSGRPLGGYAGGGRDPRARATLGRAWR